VGDGSMFLQADYNIDCSSARYRSYRSFATVMVLVYPVGVPVTYYLLLFFGHKRDSRIAGYSSMVRRIRVSTILTDDSEEQNSPLLCLCL
jgi:hypothetical protein